MSRASQGARASRGATTFRVCADPDRAEQDRAPIGSALRPSASLRFGEERIEHPGGFRILVSMIL